jgi:hypothetical protein
VDNPTSEGLKAAGLSVAEYDGGVNFLVRSVEDLMSVRIDSSYPVLRGHGMKLDGTM